MSIDIAFTFRPRNGYTLAQYEIIKDYIGDLKCVITDEIVNDDVGTKHLHGWITGASPNMRKNMKALLLNKLKITDKDEKKHCLDIKTCSNNIGWLNYICKDVVA